MDYRGILRLPSVPVLPTLLFNIQHYSEQCMHRHMHSKAFHHDWYHQLKFELLWNITPKSRSPVSSRNFRCQRLQNLKHPHRSDANDCRILSIRIADRNSSSVTLPTSRIPCTSITHTVQREKNLYNSCILSTEFDRPPNLVRDKGIYSARAGSIYRSVGPA